MKEQDEFQCPVTATLSVIGGRWKPVILFTLYGGTKRFGQLNAIISGISRKILTEQLKDLEEHGLITRTQFNETPPRVEYALSAKGKTLQPVMKSMAEWGVTHVIKADKKVARKGTKALKEE